MRFQSALNPPRNCKKSSRIIGWLAAGSDQSARRLESRFADSLRKKRNLFDGSDHAHVTREREARFALSSSCLETTSSGWSRRRTLRAASIEPLPIPSLETVFEVTVNGRVHKVLGAKLQQWIMKRREEWKGPRGLLFIQRPNLGP